ncbi:MAG: heavy-metal-associated domain-containing protein [Thermaurantiacus sp.]
MTTRISLHRQWYRCSAVAVALAIVAGLSAPADAQRGRTQQAEPETPEAMGSGSGLVVGGIEVDAAGRSLNEARLNGWREAQRLAWPALWARLSGQPQARAPRLSDSALDSIVSAIEVEREQLGANRYVASLAVVFDRARAAQYLGNLANLASSPPFLLMPVLQDAGVRMAYETDSPWLQAWFRLRAGETPVDYVRIRPSPADTLLLSAWQAERRNLRQWRVIVDRYQVADIVMPELILERSWHGGPVSALLIARFGPSGRELGRVRLINRAGDVNALLDEAVRQADRFYIGALRAGNLLPDPTLMEPVEEVRIADAPMIGGVMPNEAPGLRVRIASPDDATLRGIEQALRATPGVASLRLVTLALGSESIVDLRTTVSLDELRYNLDQRGLRLVDDGDGRLVRRRQAGDPPVPPPFGEPVLEAVPGPTDLLPSGD